MTFDLIKDQIKARVVLPFTFNLVTSPCLVRYVLIFQEAHGMERWVLLEQYSIKLFWVDRFVF